MTTTEVTEPATEATVAPVKAKAPPAAPRAKRMDKPDRAALDDKVAQLQATIDDSQARIAQLKGLIDAKKDSRRHVGGGGAPARAKLGQLRAEFKSVVDEKNSMRAELQMADAQREKLREDAKAMRASLQFVKLEHIDEEIDKLENRISHTTLSIDEERRTVDQIKQLRKSRDMVKLYNDRLERLQEDDGHRRSLIERIKEKDQQLTATKALEAQQRSILDGVRAKEEAEVAAIPQLTAERNECYEIVKQAREALRTLRAEFKDAEDKWYANERLLRAQQREERQKAWEAGQAERKEREERRKEWERENAPEPFDKEVTACEQLVSYLSKFVMPAEVAPAAVQAPKEAPAELNGMRALKRDTEDLDVMFGGLGGGKQKGKKGGGGVKGGAAKKEAKEPTMSHSLDTHASYAMLKLKAPTVKSEVASSLEELKAKKEELLAKRVVAKEQKAKEEAEGPKEPKEEAEGPKKPKEEGGKKPKKGRKGRVAVKLTVTEEDHVTVDLTI